MKLMARKTSVFRRLFGSFIVLVFFFSNSEFSNAQNRSEVVAGADYHRIIHDFYYPLPSFSMSIFDAAGNYIELNANILRPQYIGSSHGSYKGQGWHQVGNLL